MRGYRISEDIPLPPARCTGGERENRRSVRSRGWFRPGLFTLGREGVGGRRLRGSGKKFDI